MYICKVSLPSLLGSFGSRKTLISRFPLNLPPGTLRGYREGKSSIIKAHNGTIRTVAFSRDGRKLITGSDDKTVKVIYTQDALLSEHLGCTP